MEKYYTYITNIGITNMGNTKSIPEYGGLGTVEIYNTVVVIKKTESTTNKQ